MSVYEAIMNLIGPVPVGYEPLAWIAAAIILIYLITSGFSVLSWFLDFIKGR